MQRRPIRRLQPADSIHNITANVLRVLPVETIEITREDVFRRLVGDEKPMARRRQLLMRIFGRPTGILGRLGGVIMARANRDAAAQVIELLNIRADDKVLEVGFGPGVAIQLLLQRLHTGSVAGVDHSQEMVRQAAGRNAEALRNSRVDLRYGSAERLPFADQTFDKALAINSMQVWPDAHAGLREIWRVLKHGGIVALGFTVNSGQPKQGVAESLADAGFAQAQLVDRSKLFCAIAIKP